MDFEFVPFNPNGIGPYFKKPAQSKKSTLSKKPPPKMSKLGNVFQTTFQDIFDADDANEVDNDENMFEHIFNNINKLLGFNDKDSIKDKFAINKRVPLKIMFKKLLNRIQTRQGFTGLFQTNPSVSIM